MLSEGKINTVRISDKEFYPLFSAQKIQEIVAGLAKRISSDYQGVTPVFLAVLNGAFVFASDLLRKIDFHCEVSFIKLASYDGTRPSGSIRELIGIQGVLEGKNVVILEDIIDTGGTIEQLVEGVKKHNPSDIKVCALFVKPGAYNGSVKIDYTGMELENDFVVGYGMDYNGMGRNLSGIYKLKIR